MITWTEARAEIEARLNELFAPELEAIGAPRCYVIGITEISELPENPFFDGLTNPSLSSMYTKEIGDRWRGAGPAMIVNDRYFLDPEADDFGRLANVNAIVTHEAAHFVSCEPLCAFTDVDFSDEGILYCGKMRACAATPADKMPAINDKAQLLTHHAKWATMALHIAHRLRRFSWNVPVQLGWPPELSRPEIHYKAAIGDDPERMEHLSLAEVFHQPIRPEVVELHRNDLIRWREIAADQ